MKKSTANKDTDRHMEMHSEKVRKLLGDMPRSLTAWGIIVTAAIAIGLAAALCLIPYPYSGGESILVHLMSE